MRKSELSCKHSVLVIETCKTYLPRSIVDAVDWFEVELFKSNGEFPKSHAEMSDLKEARADIVYLVKMKSEQKAAQGMIILNYKHASTPKRRIPLKSVAWQP